MARSIFAALVVIVSLSTTVFAKTTMPTTIRCVDTSNNTGANIEVGLNLETNEAYLSFSGVQNYDPAYMGFGDEFGFYSSSSVSMESSYNGSSNNNQLITVSAHSSRVLRVSQYSQFLLTMNRKNDGTITLKEFSYQGGNDSYPEKSVTITLNNLPLPCTIDG